MLMSYVLDAGKNPHGLDELSRRHLGHQPIAMADLTGTGRSRIGFERVEIPRATQAARRARMRRCGSGAS
jgi:DNA polymerase-1